MAASDAEAIPLPREDTTPPVTKTNLVMSKTGTEGTRKVEIVIIDSRFRVLGVCDLFEPVLMLGLD
jgi:hypothetical protein